ESCLPSCYILVSQSLCRCTDPHSNVFASCTDLKWNHRINYCQVGRSNSLSEQECLDHPGYFGLATPAYNNGGKFRSGVLFTQQLCEAPNYCSLPCFGCNSQAQCESVSSCTEPNSNGAC